MACFSLGGQVIIWTVEPTELVSLFGLTIRMVCFKYIYYCFVYPRGNIIKRTAASLSLARWVRRVLSYALEDKCFDYHLGVTGERLPSLLMGEQCQTTAIIIPSHKDGGKIGSRLFHTVATD